MAVSVSIDLTTADKEILDVLADGRGTVGYVARQTGYTPEHTGTRMKMLAAAGYLNVVDEPTALYELANDPPKER